MRRLDGTEIPEEDAKRFRDFVNSHRWVFAKTYAAFCPHEYTLRHEATWNDFTWFAKFVWANGFDATFGKSKSRYFIDQGSGWYYFVFPVDFDEDGNVQRTMTLINRGSLNEFEFVPEETIFGTEYRVKRLPPEKRGTVY